MKALWTQDEASFQGPTVRFEPSWQWPKPRQSPHPPLVLGGDAGPRTAADVAELCDGWMPIVWKHSFERGWAHVEEACGAIGRDPRTVEVTAYQPQPSAGSLEDLARRGIARALLVIPQAGESAVRRTLDEYAQLV